MRATATRLVRVIPRSVLKADQKVYNPPYPQTRDRTRPTLMDALMMDRDRQPELWPLNLRLEPQLKKEVFKEVKPSFRSALKKMTKER
ncbi:hypothetical protein NLJ89_g8590 [Agrocybe chaxingu]|uniref:Uncharacterized protein n=1 Tax=Agrocybe chaxingu TaxID=84603 RepID=A0A9W8JV56_9AGAR|nr:hypothetical protein NLJ89_g8590 [Agrocybe chaxingu]